MLNAPEPKKYPYGYFIDMRYWPEKEIPASDDAIILHIGFLRNDSGYLVELAQIYKDPEGNYWKIEPGQYSNGASIPRFFWRILTPFSYKIRNAATFHDIYCVVQKRSQRETHRMFWWIQRLDKTSAFVAWITWFCVRVFCKIRYCYWK